MLIAAASEMPLAAAYSRTAATIASSMRTWMSTFAIPDTVPDLYGTRKAGSSDCRQAAVKQAAKMGVTPRCEGLADDMDNPDHRLCQGERPGNAGCLCQCHDRG